LTDADGERDLQVRGYRQRSKQVGLVAAGKGLGLGQGRAWDLRIFSLDGKLRGDARGGVTPQPFSFSWTRLIERTKHTTSRVSKQSHSFRWALALSANF
jgi:hypothetical protein